MTQPSRWPGREPSDPGWAARRAGASRTSSYQYPGDSEAGRRLSRSPAGESGGAARDSADL
eukprot:747244-Hanusia_phi.AAC.2